MRALTIVAFSVGLFGAVCSTSAQIGPLITSPSASPEGGPAPAQPQTSTPSAAPSAAAAPNTEPTPAPPQAPAPNPAPAPTAAAPPKTAPTGPMLYSYKVDAWDAGAYANPGTTTLAYCAAAADYKNGITLAFILDNKFEWGIVLIDPSWNLTYNANYPVNMSVDRLASGTATANAIGTAEVLISLKPNVQLFKDFMNGEHLNVQAAAGTYTFNLTNTMEMLPSLVKCVERYSGPIPASANPFAGN
jgi:hypothetical protein